MKWLLGLVLGLCLAPARAERTPFQVRCEDSLAKPQVSIVARHNGYSFDTSQSIHQLATLSTVRSTTYPVVLGVTVAEAKVEIRHNSPLLNDKISGYECVSPHIEVIVSYAPIVVYLGRELAKNSCPYKEVLAHEMRHLNTYLDNLPRVETVVRAALNKRFSDKPLYAPVGQAGPLLEREIDAVWAPYVKAELAKVETLQAAIDSAAEYERLSKVCQGEVQLILRSQQNPSLR